MIDGVVCVFGWIDNSLSHDVWRLIQTGVVRSGRVDGGDRIENWIDLMTGTMNQWEWTPTPGRLVVQWSWVGITCARFHPPSDSSPWLTSCVADRIVKMPDWYSVVMGGWLCHERTIGEVKCLLTGGGP